MKFVFAVVLLLLLLQCFHRVSSNCASYGCTSSLSFTCPTDFWPLPSTSGSRPRKALFWPDLAASYEDPVWKPTGAGCVTNDGKIVCPLTAGNTKNILMSWDVFAQYAMWNKSMSSLVPLPVISTYGEIYVTDGDELCGFDTNQKPLGPCIKMEPTSGPLYDLTVVAQKFLYLLYKCGFMVAYFVSDGTAYASIWLNTTLDGRNGTFIPLSNPAVSGERVYFIAGFKGPMQSSTPTLRLYAIDVRTIMVDRIKIIWYHDVTLNNSAIPFLESSQASCSGQSDPLDDPVANVFYEDGIVVASVNFIDLLKSGCTLGESCQRASYTNSLLISVTDKGDSYTLNYDRSSQMPFQAVAYASPTFTVSECSKAMPNPPPSMWVSWASGNRSLLEKKNIKTGDPIYKVNIASLKDVKLTSKLSIFYNDQLVRCWKNGSREHYREDALTPLMFGYSSNGQNYIAALDVSSSEPELRWSVKTPGSARGPAVGQITSVGKGRDTMMALTTPQGAYFYILFAEDE